MLLHARLTQNTPVHGPVCPLSVFVLLVTMVMAALTCMPGMALVAWADTTNTAAAASEQAKDGAGSAAGAQDEASKEADARAKTEEVVKAKAEREEELRQKADAAAAQKQQEVAEIAENDPLRDIWAGQRAMIDSVIEQSTAMSESFLKDTSVLDQIRPVEQEINKQLLLVSEFQSYPSPLEAVSRRLALSADLVKSLVVSAGSMQYSAQELLNQLERSADSMSEIAMLRYEDTAEYMEKINTARFLLTAIISRYTAALAPAQALVDKVNQTRADITARLPQLWKNYYTQKPVPWFTAAEWLSLPRTLSYFGLGLELRKAVELPLTTTQLQGCILRFVVTLVSVGLLSFMLCNQLLRAWPEVREHILWYCLPWNVVGLSLCAASWSNNTEFFRLFMALGNLALIIGQVTLAWQLRRIKFPENTLSRSPIFALIPLTFGAYILFYLPLPRLIAMILWLLFLVINLWICHRSTMPDLGRMQLEKSILSLQPIVLWPCLLLCIVGLHFYSMAIYLLYTSLCVAVQISVASLSFISRLNESLDNEDTSTMWLSFLLAISAPVVLLLAAAVVSLWLATLPGGLDLLQFYIFKSVSIGETQLNLVQVLLIATVFFLARTAARMGKNLISRLPERGMRVDRSLITPLQTAYSYVVWCLFGFFVLKSLGLNLSNLAVIAGGLSVGIGFGMQTIVNNFISGIILIFSRNLQVGDVVEVGTVVGRIKQINVRATVVETYDSAVIYVPNSAFVSGNLTNWTSNSRTTRQQVVVGVAYGTDTELVSRLMLEVANKSSDVLAFPKPVVQFQAFGASTLDFRLLFWVKDYDMATGVASQLRYAINKSFAEHNIEIAFPQMDVHLKSSTGPKPAPRTPSVRRMPVRRGSPARPLRPVRMRRLPGRQA